MTLKSNSKKSYPFARPPRDLSEENRAMYVRLVDEMQGIVAQLRQEVDDLDIPDEVDLTGINSRLNALELLEQYSLPANIQSDITALQQEVSNLSSQISVLSASSTYMNPVTVTNGDSPYPASQRQLILVDTSGGAVVIDLPASSTAIRWPIMVKVIDATSTVTIDGNGSETIDGATTLVLSSLWDSAVLYNDGTGWYVL